MSLFKQIFYKNLKKGTNPTKLVEDIGPLRGIVQWHQIDEKTNKIIKSSEKYNALVNQSKTNLIRLISQGQSPWIGQINPANLRISRMRFGNANDFSTPSKFYYYNIGELSTRVNNPVDAFAAGGDKFTNKFDNTTRPAGGFLPTTIEKINNIGSNGYQPGAGGEKIYTINNLNIPPSQGTFRIEFWKTGGLAPVETLYFGNASGEIFTYPYTRKTNGNAPTKIISASSNESDKICTPSHATRPDAEYEITHVTPETNSRLFYDYSTTSWKYVSYENNNGVYGGNTMYDLIRFIYDIGKYNVINSIIPRNGFNRGEGLNLLRYDGMTQGDFYPISVNSVEYRDSDDDFIDDFSATFSVVMSGQYGNGNTDAIAGDKIKYTEAFLFNEIDQMFSAVYLNAPFEKNSLTAFYISWTILAPVN
jgi:hypothetical protein